MTTLNAIDWLLRPAGLDRIDVLCGGYLLFAAGIMAGVAVMLMLEPKLPPRKE